MGLGVDVGILLMGVLEAEIGPSILGASGVRLVVDGVLDML